MMVSSVFKKYNQYVEPSMSSKDASMVSESLKDLQYMDVFSQKLNHVIHLNQLVEEAQVNLEGHHVDHAGFIFKLNYLQATVAAVEFVSNAEDLRKNLHDLHAHIISVTGLDFHEDAYFSHLKEVERRMQGIKVILEEVQQERYREAPISVTGIEREVNKISSIYAMASERFVLWWLLKHTNSPIEDLLLEYGEEGYGTEEEIDLF
jgi:hypothetical protein